MNEIIQVGISDYKTAKTPATLVTYALGSCVGVSLYDPCAGIGGLSHIMLPSRALFADESGLDRMKYADTAIADLTDELVRVGAKRESLKAKIAGGANMFGATGASFADTIGERNVEAVREELARLGIPIVAEDVGADYGRTIYFLLKDGTLRVQSLGRSVSEI